MSNNSFLCSKRGNTSASASTTLTSSASAGPKKMNAFMNTTAAAAAAAAAAASATVANSFAGHVSTTAGPDVEFPQLRARTATATATATDTSSSVPATRVAAAVGLNYKGSLLTAIDDRMLEEQDRMRRTQRRDAEAKREVYEKLKYDNDRAAVARAAFEPDYNSNSAFDASLADDGEGFFSRWY